MKMYIGRRDPGGEAVVRVQEGESWRLLPSRTDIRNHSPTGFEWGYGGSGPAQLALALLADHLGPKPSPERCPWCGSACKDWKCQANTEDCGFDGNKTGEAWDNVQAVYQDFKRDVISQLNQNEGFEFTSDAIDLWLVNHHKQ